MNKKEFILNNLAIEDSNLCYFLNMSECMLESKNGQTLVRPELYSSAPSARSLKSFGKVVNGRELLLPVSLYDITMALMTKHQREDLEFLKSRCSEFDYELKHQYDESGDLFFSAGLNFKVYFIVNRKDDSCLGDWRICHETVPISSYNDDFMCFRETISTFVGCEVEAMKLRQENLSLLNGFKSLISKANFDLEIMGHIYGFDEGFKPMTLMGMSYNDVHRIYYKGTAYSLILADLGRLTVRVYQDMKKAGVNLP